MKLSSYLAVLAGGLLAAGSACAQPTTPATPPASPATNAPAPMTRAPRFDMGTYLNLTDAQKPQVQPILDADRQQRMSVMQDSSIAATDKRARIKAIHDDTAAKLQKLLTADQFAKWQHIQQPRMRRTMTPLAPVANTNVPPPHPTPAQ